MGESRPAGAQAGFPGDGDGSPQACPALWPSNRLLHPRLYSGQHRPLGSIRVQTPGQRSCRHQHCAGFCDPEHQQKLVKGNKAARLRVIPAADRPSAELGEPAASAKPAWRRWRPLREPLPMEDPGSVCPYRCSIQKSLKALHSAPSLSRSPVSVLSCLRRARRRSGSTLRVRRYCRRLKRGP